MIVVRLMGGLGNQMFQYALGRRLASERGVPLKLDLTWFDQVRRGRVDTPRELALQGWRIRPVLAERTDLAAFPRPPGEESRFGRILRRLLPQPKGELVVERRTGFDPAVLKVRAPAHLIGYWQNESYFKPIRASLTQEFTLATPPCAHAAALCAVAENGRSVAVHVRRGDYALVPATNAFHGTLPVEYYMRAAKRIAERVENPEYLVFSDDLDWARSNLKLGPRMHFVEHAMGCAPHHDLWLMTRCSHHIIANSSFSWWGAWLSDAGDKTVVAPRQWFRDERHDCRDIVPADWVVL